MIATTSARPLFQIKTQKGMLSVSRPSKEHAAKTKEIAKKIFVEAFSTTYTQYHINSKSVDTIEKWLRLRDGFTLNSWLEATFEGDYTEFTEGKKEFVYLTDENENLLGWLTHTPVSKTGEVYLSQCSLEADSRNKKIATTGISEALSKENLEAIFPKVTEIKLITRKINEYARRLYTNAGFHEDLQISPAQYGDDYDDRYVGYRMTIEGG